METFTRDGLTFDVTDSGPTDGRVVVLLHGFPEDRHCWGPIRAQLVAAGYRVLAPDQRGYSPGARPSGRRSYVLKKLRDDVLALADVARATRFDVVGHDWGAVVAWDLAARHPERVRSGCALSVPHPSAFRDSFFRSSQLAHSWYMLMFQIPVLPEAALRVGARSRAVGLLEKGGLDHDSAVRYASRFAERGAMTGPINWYRGLPFALREGTPPCRVPTLFVWSDGDAYVTRKAAEGCARYVTARYRFEVLAGVSHWIPSEAPDQVAPLLLDHLAGVSD